MLTDDNLNRFIQQLTRTSASSLASNDPAHDSKVQKYILERSENDDVHISYLEQAKNYMATHLSKEFDLEDMAKEIGINPSYLSRKFKEYEHMGIAEYTNRKRIQAAQNMLKYSDADISAIAQYLCFHSQSYFGAVFKEYTGISPGKYREQEKVTDFCHR